MFKGPLLIIFIINVRTSLCVIDALYYTGREVWRLYSMLENVELNISQDARDNGQLSDNVTIREIKEQVDKIYEQLNQLENFMGPKKILDSIRSWQLSALTMRDIDKIELFVLSIDKNFELFYVALNASDYSPDSFKALLQEYFQTVEGNMEAIREIATGTEKYRSKHQTAVAEIADFAAINNATICQVPRIISNILIQLFKMIIVAEMKTSTMLAYRNFLGYMNDKNDEWRRSSSSAREEFERQFAIHTQIFSPFIAEMDRTYNRACDPPGGNWIRGKSFHELEKTFQATIFYYPAGICPYQSCNEVMTSYRQICLPLLYGGPISTGSSHADLIAECAYLNNITACLLESGPYRFQYVNSAELGFLGRNSSCPKDNGRVLKSKTRADGTDAACVCNAYSSHNKISLFMIESDVKSNRVITGLRFICKNGVLWIQPREGTLESDNYINPHSQRWIPIPGNISSSLIEPINKVNRVFILDDLGLPVSFVLTGVKFNKVTRESVSGFAIEIFGNRFHFRAGKLFLGAPFRQSRKGPNEKSGKSLSFKAVSSVFTTLLHTVTPLDTKYVSLERSTLRDDFGQSTLPLFDAVPVTVAIPTALRGFGIFHKGVEGYAGFISLRVYGIKYEEYFNDFKSFYIMNNRVLFNCSAYC